VKRDLELKLTLPRTVKNVYAVAIDSNTMEIDREGTKKLREKSRQARKNRGIPAKEYIEREREKIRRGELPLNPKNCLNDCMRVSEKFCKEFREFWGLPEDFTMIP